MALPSRKESAAEIETEVAEVPIIEPDKGTIEWIHYWRLHEGLLPSPINISITGSIFYNCPPILWYNFDIYPHKMKLTNNGYQLILSAKWSTERPYVTGGPFLPGKKYVFSQLHFHWGRHMMEGSEHPVDGTRHPMEMHVVYFDSVYLSQNEAFNHDDGIVVMCYMIRFGVVPDARLNLVLDALPRVREAQAHTRVGPAPLSRLLTMFVNDYFLYWGALSYTAQDRVALWLVARVPMSASEDQVKMFRRLWDSWDEPNTSNYRELQDTEDRHIFFVNPEWSMYTSLLPIPRSEIPSISEPSPAYIANTSMIPLLNTELRQKYCADKTGKPDSKN